MIGYKMKPCGCIVEDGIIYQCNFHQNEMYVALGFKKKNTVPKPVSVEVK